MVGLSSAPVMSINASLHLVTVPSREWWIAPELSPIGERCIQRGISRQIGVYRELTQERIVKPAPASSVPPLACKNGGRFHFDFDDRTCVHAR